MCGFNCTLTRAGISQPRNTWGCPCGVGYWDEINKEFVTGDSVRSGESRSRDQYLAHLQECSKCRTQAQLDGLDPISVDPNLQGYWISEEGIDLGIFSESIKSYLGDNAFVLPGTNPVCLCLASTRNGTVLIFSLERWDSWLSHQSERCSNASKSLSSNYLYPLPNTSVGDAFEPKIFDQAKIRHCSNQCPPS
jgi:hypothetical protein